MNVFGKINNQREVLNSVFVNASNAVIYEARAQKNSKRKDFRIVFGILIKSTDPLRIKNYYVDCISFLCLPNDWLAPDPEPLLRKKNEDFKKEENIYLYLNNDYLRISIPKYITTNKLKRRYFIFVFHAPYSRHLAPCD